MGLIDFTQRESITHPVPLLSFAFPPSAALSWAQQEVSDVLKGEKDHILLAFEEGENVLYGLIPFDFLHSLRHELAPVCGGQLGSSPTGLGESIIQEGKIRLGPSPVGQVPSQIVQIPSFRIAARENGMQLPGQKGRTVVVEQVQSDETPDHGGACGGPRGGIRVDLDPDGDGLILALRKAEFEEDPFESDEGGFHRPLIPNFDFNRVAFCLERRPDLAQEASERILHSGRHERKIEVFGITRHTKEEAQRRSADKHPCEEGTLVLERLENAGLQVFAGGVSLHEGVRLLRDNLRKKFLHLLKLLIAPAGCHARKKLHRALQRPALEAISMHAECLPIKTIRRLETKFFEVFRGVASRRKVEQIQQSLLGRG